MSRFLGISNFLISLAVTTASPLHVLNQEHSLALINPIEESPNPRPRAQRIVQREQGYAEAQRRIQTALETQESNLDLDRLSLTQIPPEIGQLKNLQRLYLSENQLSSLPPEMSQLRKLRILDLQGNPLPPRVME